ncbi:hypothetical protein KKD19_01000 [Patescibacteria group bacterium]|nr:hypothetical protein [Patescibacteria group bacterium]MCG2692559.1 hypothetical protein [Candidatus Parcubacteria bacterium]
MEIKLLSNDTEKIWDKLIQQSPFCRFSETTNFKNVLKETYYYKPNYLLIKNQGQIIALLPAVRKNKKLISMPFADYGDLIIINPIVSPAEIVQALKNFLQEKNINYLKIISGLNIQSSSLQKHFQKQPNDSRAVLILDKDPDSLFKKFDYSVRKAIKKSESANLKCSQNNSHKSMQNHF